jgi:hypothetical protein
MARDGLTLEQMGERRGVTRQRIEQILRFGGVETPKTWVRDPKVWSPAMLETCSYCGEKWSRTQSGRRGRADTMREQSHAAGYAWGLQEHCRQAKHPHPDRSFIHMSEGIAKDYEQGMGLKQITEKWNVHHYEEIYRHLKRWGVPTRRKNNRPIGKDLNIQRAIAERYKTQEAKEIGAAFGITDSRVHQIAAKFGVNKRDLPKKMGPA